MRKATALQFQKLLTRSCPLLLTGEARLAIAVLSEAWKDGARCGKSSEGLDARRFFTDGRAAWWASLIDIEPEWLVEIFKKHHPRGAP
ncbi:MAG: hypothetical protein KGI54_17155 [Pseudomonadota bacterium]|nr:hypothetical protein [Pseudomonadota bacterium]